MGFASNGISVPSLSIGLPVAVAILVVFVATAKVKLQVTLAVGATGPANPAHSALVSVTSSLLSATVPASSVIVRSARCVSPVFVIT